MHLPGNLTKQGGTRVRLQKVARTSAARFLIAGGGASGVNWLVRFPLSSVLPFIAAVALAYAIGMVVGFMLYRDWVFPGSQLTFANQAVRFVAVNLLGFTTVVATSWMAEGVAAAIGVPVTSGFEAMTHAAAIAAGAVVNFLGHRGVSFARHPR